MVKRMLAMAMAAVLALSVCACGGKEGTRPHQCYRGPVAESAARLHRGRIQAVLPRCVPHL